MRVSRSAIRVTRRAAAAWCACILAACKSVGPNFSPPHEAVPEQYAGAAADAAHPPAQGASGPRPNSNADPESFWWQQFHDADLNRLQSQAAAGNLDLRAALRDGASDAALVEAIRGKWLRRTDRYSEQREDLRRGAPHPRKIEMYYIGG